MNKIILKDLCSRKKMNKIRFSRIKVIENIWVRRISNSGIRKQKEESKTYKKVENKQKFPLYHSIDHKLLETL